MGRRSTARLAAALLAALVTASLSAPSAGFGHVSSAPRQLPAEAITSVTSDPRTWTTRTLRRPSRVQVLDASGVLATFTTGARSVTLRGVPRVLAEPASTTAEVRTSTWVRLLARPFTGEVDAQWLSSALTDSTPDVLASALQYVTGAPSVTTDAGVVVAADASYGPLQPDGTRQEGSDFNDFLQVDWPYGHVQDAPEPAQAVSLDCSGLIRMVMGYRHGVPLSLKPDGVRLPRRAMQMAASAPGVVTIPSTGDTPPLKALARLAPGDLLFFDASADDGAAIDHVALYLGRDANQAPRFLSSRKTVDGPTLGDVGGRSLLTGTGLYATSWRSARRL